MNFHLILVHFPIALLTTYACLEIISIKKLNNLAYWFYIKALLVIAGAASAYATLESGDLIESKFKYVRDVVEVHSTWATLATVIFTVCAVVYAIAWVNNEWHLNEKAIGVFAKMWNILTKISTVLLKRPVIVAIALLGLCAITVTGALGGAIAQGPDVDPVVHFVYYLFFTK